MRTFFILSLPRSRTAWLANFLTFGESYCFHEGLLGCGSMENFRKKMLSTGFPVVGNSDCGNVLFFDRLIKLFPDSKIVIIRRDLEAVLESLESMGSGFGNIDPVIESEKILNRIEKSHPALVVNYEGLDENGCSSIWEYCTGTEFNAERWKMLDGIRMEIDKGKKLEQVRKSASSAFQLNEVLH